LSLPVLADPFWGRLLGLLTRRAEKHSKHRKFSLMPDAFVCDIRFGWKSRQVPGPLILVR
jgi:hypothetical protein